MTTFGWDASHYDGTPTVAQLAKAKSEGIQFFTHKVGEGEHTGDSTQGTTLANARSAGIEVLGAYWFIHGNDSIAAEVAAMVAQLDAHESWWRTHPYFFIQCDAETSPTGLPSPTFVKAWCDAAAKATGKTVVCYASHGMYGDRLTGLGHPLWNANYPSDRKAGFASLYPGDSFSGWKAYSGQTPIICQFSSSATIGGLTTCDANAFRGTLAQLKSLISGGNAIMGTPAADDVWNDDIIPNGAADAPDNPTTKAAFALGDARTRIIALQAEVTELKAAVAKIPTTAGTATISAADKADIVKGVLDGFAARQAN